MIDRPTTVWCWDSSTMLKHRRTKWLRSLDPRPAGGRCRGRPRVHTFFHLVYPQQVCPLPSPPVSPLRLSKGVKIKNLKMNEKSKQKVNKIKQMKSQRKVKNENQPCVCAPAEPIMRRENKKRREMKA